MTLEELLAQEGVDGEAVVAWARERVETILAELPPDSDLAELLREGAFSAPITEENLAQSTTTPADSEAGSQAEVEPAQVHEISPKAAPSESDDAEGEEIELLDADDVELLDVDLMDDEETVADARNTVKDNHG